MGCCASKDLRESKGGDKTDDKNEKEAYFKRRLD